MNTTQATLEDIDVLTDLFDGYRQFYKQQSDKVASKVFLKARLANEEAFVFIARDDAGTAAGFTLLYPMFSSVRQKRVYILNDLFVHPDHRRKGVGALLLDRAVQFGKEQGAAGLQLETEVSNTKAQGLYEKEGWSRVEDEFFYTYDL